jgi:hypothetical protein
VALADQPGADWMSKVDIKKQMEAQGYSSILVEADDGPWEGEAIKDGRIVEFRRLRPSSLRRAGEVGFCGTRVRARGTIVAYGCRGNARGSAAREGPTPTLSQAGEGEQAAPT